MLERLLSNKFKNMLIQLDGSNLMLSVITVELHNIQSNLDLIFRHPLLLNYWFS